MRRQAKEVYGAGPRLATRRLSAPEVARLVILAALLATLAAVAPW